MTDFITGIANHYYTSEDNAKAGIVAVNDEVYARQNADGQTWDVYRMVCYPVVPEGMKLSPKITSIFLMMTLLTLDDAELPQTIAENVTRDEAFRLVREHEETPATFDAFPILRQVAKPEDGRTYWRNTPAPKPE